eukprot:CAMPEP_0185766008 /NCGR_PEP_ID=MMETSP1174-20130828/34523_1 /TAXON_ID=35687 /ORGANISM="Dictyocha speculum, Strain CCMP1381" /LENGTH=47 /DNA_ID= /DNA_START= /DNA_END= /DNA_ORIENTATION=
MSLSSSFRVPLNRKSIILWHTTTSPVHVPQAKLRTSISLSSSFRVPL